ncbi:MAG: divergent polysaccharide deacetylase family protein, partial [Woeseia sp.]
MTRQDLRKAPFLLLLLLVTSELATAADPIVAKAVTRPRIALIIDDLGYGLTVGRRTIDLPGPVACAVLPDTPRARVLAELAAAHGKEVLLHLPLQAQDGAGHSDPG